MHFLKLFISGILFLSLSALGQNSQWNVINTANSGLPHNTVNHIIQDNAGNYWIATLGGLAKYDGHNWTVYTISNSNLANDGISSLAFDGNTLWIGYSHKGLGKFDGTTFTNYNLDEEFNVYYQGLNTVHGVDIDKNHNVWIATTYGLIKYNGSTFVRYHNGNGLVGPSSRVWSVKCDTANDIVWAGTFHAGLQKFDGTSFTGPFYMYDPSIPYWGDWQEVNSITIEADGDIWVSGTGIIEFDKTTMVQKHVYNTVDEELDPLTWGMAFDHTNKLWVGSDCLYGVFCLNNGSWTTYNETNSGFPQGTCYSINAIHVDQNNSKWMAHNSKGVIVYNEAGLVGVTDNRLPEHSLNVFPNPTSSRITFGLNYNDVAHIEVFDYTGKSIQIKSYPGNGNNLELEVSSLPRGIYNYRMLTDNFKSYSGKFIKE